MARPKAADYDETRDRILLRAVQAFAESGYPSASMSSLAARCDTSKAALYHYFDSKVAILFESLDRYTARLLSVVQQAEAAVESGHAVQPGNALPTIAADRETGQRKLRAVVRALLIEYRDSTAYHVVLLNDVKFLSPTQRERIRAQERAVIDAFGRVLAAASPGRFSGAEARPATLAILGMINFTFAWLRPDGPMSHERFAELVTDIALRGIAGNMPSIRR